jgi:uncharacterized alpha-E superfamily protein
MGAQRAFHWAYGGEVTAAKIADFLILNPQSPRSLHLHGGPDKPPRPPGQGLWPRDRGTGPAPKRLAAGIEAATVEAIFDEGLHEFLTRYIAEAATLANAIHDSYLSGEMR